MPHSDNAEKNDNSASSDRSGEPFSRNLTTNLIARFKSHYDSSSVFSEKNPIRKFQFRPALFAALREGYGRKELTSDLMSGLLVGIIALPLAIAFAVASGVKPEQGIFTAIIAGFIISALGGSRHQIGGPTGAFVVIVAGIVAKHGIDGLAIATLAAGFLLILMGIGGFGAVMQFIPYPVIVGFTAGIAVIIAIGQLPDFFGITGITAAEPLEKGLETLHHLAAFNPATLAVSVGGLLLLLVVPKIHPRIPASLVVVLAATLAVQLLGLDVVTIGSRFGAVPSGLPMPHLPTFHWNDLRELASPIIAIALLGGMESLLSAVVADGMTGNRHHANTELVAQGIANVASPIFGGIPATGAIARTAANIRAGARSPVSGMIHAITLLIILLVAGKWAALIPMAALAPILLVVAWNMSEAHLLFQIMRRSSRSDVLVLITTFFLTVAIDLVVAIEVGVVLAALLFMRRMSEVAQVSAITGMDGVEEMPGQTRREYAALPKDVVAYEVFGALFFGAADKFKDALLQLDTPPKVFILRMRHVLAIDSTGLRALEDITKHLRARGCQLVISGIHAQPLLALERAEFTERLGRPNVCASWDEAVARAEVLRNTPRAERTGQVPAVK